jgi:tRNA G10  N-methylase Trm11
MRTGASWFTLEEREDWRFWVTPKPLYSKPVHRWYVFPHSFSSELVHALIEEWGLTPKDRILDPFVGSGTTLLAAKEKGIPSTGYDLSPLAVFVARVKTTDYDAGRLHELWSQLREGIRLECRNGATKDYPDLVRKALPGELLGAFEALDRSIMGLDATQEERNFFRLALLATIPEYSRVVAEGGWLRWVDRHRDASALLDDFTRRVTLMLEDVEKALPPRRTACRVGEADARSLPDADFTYPAVITSPPYPNRHDYTRVFGVELMFGFLDGEGTRRLRYQTFHSHPEARPVRPEVHGYTQPTELARAIEEIARKEKDRRVKKMLEGYFTDMYLTLREVSRVSKRGARIAFVVGNAQYKGVPIAVDEFTAEIGEQVGLKCQKLMVVRYRGNSAQQMRKYGRKPSRETVVVFQKV